MSGKAWKTALRNLILRNLIKNRNRCSFVAATLCLGAAGLCPAPAMASSCSDLGTSLSLQLDDGASLVGPATVQDITSGSYTPAGSATPIPGLPPFCRVALDISSTGDSSQSQILVEVWLPETGWNGRYLGTGNGGFAGAISTAALSGGLLQGYAVANTDMGTGVLYKCNSLYCGGRTGFGGPPAGLYGHPDSIKDFGYRATHLMTVAAKQVVEAYYGKPQHHAYFAGCSTGGNQSLMDRSRCRRAAAAAPAAAAPRWPAGRGSW